MTRGNPLASPLHCHTERELLIKILSELRVQSLLMAQGFNISEEIGVLRNEVMKTGNTSDTDL